MLFGKNHTEEKKNYCFTFFTNWIFKDNEHRSVNLKLQILTWNFELYLGQRNRFKHSVEYIKQNGDIPVQRWSAKAQKSISEYLIYLKSLAPVWQEEHSLIICLNVIKIKILVQFKRLLTESLISIEQIFELHR